MTKSDVPERSAPDEETLVRVVVADIDHRLESPDHERIERTVRRHIRVWLDGARIKTYVGLIAERHALEELRSFEPSRGL